MNRLMFRCEGCGFVYAHSQAEMVARVRGEHQARGCDPATCPKCSREFPSRDALDAHFATVKHWLDADYPVHVARMRVVEARDRAERLASAYGAALADIEDAEAHLSAVLEVEA